MQLHEEIRRSHVVGRAAGRHRLEVELGQPLHAAAGALEDDAFADIVAQSLASAWGSTGLSILGGKPTTITARDLDQLADLLDARVRRAAATETARVFNREREALIDEHVGAFSSSTRGPRDPDVPAAGAFKVWSAILDRATCPRCFGLDGEIVELHKSFSIGSPPPMHPHCRCIVEFIVVHKPERLEDIAIDYDLFKREVHDLIIEGRAESQRHAVSFASDSLGNKRSVSTLTTRFADERYATTRSPIGGGAPPPPPRGGGAGGQPPPPPGGGGGGTAGGGGPRKPLTFVPELTIDEVRKIPAEPAGPLPATSRDLFRGRCPDAPSWHRLFEPPSGYELKFKNVDGERGELKVSADIYAANGKRAGDLVRRFRRNDDGELVVAHDWMDVRPAFQKLGISESISRAQLLGYREMGVQAIEIQAAWIGRYTWASFGYSWPEHEAPLWQSRLQTFLTRELGDAAAAHEIASTVTHAHEFATLTAGNREIGREFLLHPDTPSWYGGLRLVDGDVGFEYAKKRLGL